MAGHQPVITNQAAAYLEQRQQTCRESIRNAEQERIREQFSQMEKLSALGELASGVAHDFNNTLAGILGRAQLLLRTTSDPEKMKRGLDIIIKTAEDGAKTVKRIQDFARQRRDHDFELVSIDQILTDASEITRPRWKNWAEASNIHINLDLQTGSKAKVMGDDSELREVLVNMVFNAIDAMPAGGKVTIKTEHAVIDELAARQYSYPFKPGPYVLLTVTDTGVGMDAATQTHIFEPFFTTKDKGKGTGLGLATVYGVVKQSDGYIEVHSEIGAGTTFKIYLPRVDEPVDPGKDSPSATPSLHGDETILLVEDEDSLRRLTLRKCS